MSEFAPGERYAFRNRRWPRSLRRLVLDEQGLTERWRKPLVHSWDEIYGVVWNDNHVVIHLAGRRLRVGRKFGDWRRFGQLVEQHATLLQPHPEAEDLTVTPEQLAKWLGIDEEGELICNFGTRRRIWGWVALLIAVMMLVGALGLPDGGGGGLWGSVPSLLMLGIGMVLSADKVRADVHGISLRVKGRPQTYAWSEIESLHDSGQYITVKTTRGKFQLSTTLPNFVVLRRALHHVIAARGVGAVLPSDTPVTEAAISRMTGEEPTDAVVERGLSRPEG